MEAFLVAVGAKEALGWAIELVEFVEEVTVHQRGSTLAACEAVWVVASEAGGAGDPRLLLDRDPLVTERAPDRAGGDRHDGSVLHICGRYSHDADEDSGHSVVGCVR